VGNQLLLEWVRSEVVGTCNATWTGGLPAVTVYAHVDDWDALPRGHDIKTLQSKKAKTKKKDKTQKKRNRSEDIGDDVEEVKSRKNQRESTNYIQAGQQLLEEKFGHLEYLAGFAGQFAKDGTTIFYKAGGYVPCPFSNDQDYGCEPYFIYNTVQGTILQKCKRESCQGSKKGKCKEVVNLLNQAMTQRRKEARELHLEKNRKEHKQK